MGAVDITLPPPELETAPLLTAYVINASVSLPLLPAPRARPWMNATNERFANRCLPLLIANQAGWILVSGHSLRVSWNGRNDIGGVTVEYLKGGPPFPASSHFGYGIVTWNVPYLFRTSPGYNLLVRGPANWPKDGIAPLEGVVETDWSAATFTVNWRLTRANHPVSFEEGEPICMLVPQRRGELEAFRPEVRPLDDDPALAERYHGWSGDRAAFNAALAVPGSEAVKRGWQKHYFQDVSLDGSSAPTTHQTKLALRPFAGAPPPPVPAPAPLPAPATRRPLPPADEILRGLVVIEGFLEPAACQALVGLHQRLGTLGPHSDNGYALGRARTEAPAQFEAARSITGRIGTLIEERFGERVACDLALLCALTARGFRHTLHADNARVVCPRHGDDQQRLRAIGCRCTDAEVRPNHTAWRRYSALLYLSGNHRGGDIVFGEGPNAFGGLYRREIRVRPGLLVLSPSSELYFHETTPVTSGTRYSMNSWYTNDPAHTAPEWQ